MFNGLRIIAEYSPNILLILMYFIYLSALEVSLCTHIQTNREKLSRVNEQHDMTDPIYIRLSCKVPPKIVLIMTSDRMYF